MDEIYKSNKYFFLFAHPDDELYCCILIKRLIKLGKEVFLSYATNGDSGGNSEIRKKELIKSINKIGIKKKNINFYEISEKKLLDSIGKVIELSITITSKNNVDCIIGQNYEGGHEGHDTVSFCSSEIAKRSKINDYFVFPVYHGRPQERKGARFKVQRKKYLTLKLTKKEQKIKKEILNIYKSQKNHFNGLQKSSNDYLDLLFSREIFFQVTKKINFLEKPMPVVGYEYHRNNFKFNDFKKAIKNYNKSQLLNIPTRNVWLAS